MSPECKIDRNRHRCGCTYSSCERRGKCCECLQSHWQNGELPGCLFPPELEKTYNRSLKAFITYWKDKC